MQLIGYLDSPYVRRVAISMRMLGLAYEHRELSVFREFEEFRSINPLVKVPTLLLDDGQVLVESGLIIAYLESQVAGRSLMPHDPAAYQRATQQIGVALVAKEKIVGLLYETGHRPAELQHPPWIERLSVQLEGALKLMETAVADSARAGQPWLHGEAFTQADITTAVAWRFALHIDAAAVAPADYPALSAYSTRAEALPEFTACPVSG